ncbi:MAG: hypothetical protein V4598_05595 [Bdellovibrionota bacterium]
MKSLFIVLTVLFSLSASADAINAKCTGVTASGDSVALSIKENKVRITSEGSQPISGTILGDAWDGHVAGLLTGQAFSIKYENHYGCIVDVELTTIINAHLTTVAMKECTTTQNGREYCRR